jgi:hypothetical protein
MVGTGVTGAAEGDGGAMVGGGSGPGVVVVTVEVVMAAMVVLGTIDAGVEESVSSWDLAGTSVLVTESAGVTTSSVSGPLLPITAKTVVAATASTAAEPPTMRRRLERAAIMPIA